VKHRVKNNLQSTIGILDFQIEQFYNGKSIEDITLSTQNRLKSIAVLHDKLLNKNHIVNQDIKKYFHEIIELNIQSNTNTKKMNDVNLLCNVSNLDMDKLMYLGIITSELMTNSFKYAFEKIEKPEITIEITQTGNNVLFIYADNGKGFDVHKTKKGTGMTIIEGLVSQMQGAYKIHADNNGTKININFKS
ncbi:MAG: sensor histidine kinase, partial [Bacteroidetes bacterium]